MTLTLSGNKKGLRMQKKMKVKKVLDNKKTKKSRILKIEISSTYIH